MKEFLELFYALPRCFVGAPNGNVSWIFDQNKNRIGSIHWKDGTITIFEEYEYSQEIITAIGAHRFSTYRSHLIKTK